MGEHTYYTLGEARHQLGDIDWKTLKKWLNQTHIEPEIDPGDTRIKRLSRTQLVRLASLHGIKLQEQEAIVPPSPASSPTEAQERIAIEAYIDAALEERFQRLNQQLDRSLQESLSTMKQELFSVIQDVLRQILATGTTPTSIRSERRMERSRPFDSSVHPSPQELIKDEKDISGTVEDGN